MADQQHGAGVVGEHLLQQVEGLEIEIVGRLVEDQQVGGCASARASISRPRSPPESTPSGVRACSGANRKSLM